MAVSAIHNMIECLRKADSSGIMVTVKELKENQYGFPLAHYAQQYLFGSTGLRIKVFNSISGMPQACKSPLLFDLMGHVCASPEHGGLGGLGFLYELEDKISPTLLAGVMANYGEDVYERFNVVKDRTLDQAFEHLCKQIIPAYRKNLGACECPIIIGFDSIGGAASSDLVDKFEKEGVVGKGFHEKAHWMKHFCENAAALIGNIPMVIVCINQEKEAAAAAYGPPQKTITGGKSQVFKDGHMISSSYKTLASGDGKLLTLKTTKTSFSDARKIEVAFRWNKFGATDPDTDAYGHHFEWALASAKCIADPEKGVGEIRDICDVKVADSGLVTCTTFGLRSVPAEEFEAALFDSANEKTLNALYQYQKIEKIKDLEAYKAFVKSRKDGTFHATPEEQPTVTVTKRRGRKPATANDAADEAPEQEPQSEEA